MGPIRVGVVGLRFGARIIDQLRDSPLFEVAAVCDDDPARAGDVGARAGDVGARAGDVGARAGVPVRATLDELLADDDLAAVALFIPPGGRAHLVRWVVRAGKHVLTTKPFELDPDEAHDVLAEARSLDRAVHLNSPAPGVPPDLGQVARWLSWPPVGSPPRRRPRAAATPMTRGPGRAGKHRWRPVLF